MQIRTSTFHWTATLLVPLACAGCGREPAPAPHVAVDDVTESMIAHGRIPFLYDFERGSELARETGKPLLVFFTANWCDYCQALAEEAFRQDAVVQSAEQFICVLVDVDREQSLCQRFQVRSYPTIQFVSPDGIALNRLIGKTSTHELVLEMQAVLQTVAHRPSESGGNRLR